MTHRSPASRTLKVDALARVEGEGAMYVETREGEVTDVQLRIYEPPRFFEGFLRGRSYTEPPDITARVCGICPVAYQMSACQAIESLCGVEVDGPLAELRRLLYCGEWIESHTLHIYLLHAPDFLGYQSAIELAEDHRETVERGLALKKTGNELIDLIGGRAVHPINVRVGGFYRVPSRRELARMVDPLRRARDAALETVRWVSSFDFPDFDQSYEFVSLSHPDEYPIMRGRLVSSGGRDFAVDEFDTHIVEEHVGHSTALQARLIGGDHYFVGPMARFNLNADRLDGVAAEAVKEVGLEPQVRNPFRSIIVRAVEVLYAVDEALRIIDRYEEPDRPALEVAPRAGVGHGCTEAPRGILYHRYELDDDGVIVDARMVPPTSQNQATVEHDLWHFVEDHIELSHPELTLRCEQAIRNYDPCISCATHFLDLVVEDAHTATCVVIGVGNEFRRDDGVGLEVARRVAAARLPGVRVLALDGEASRIVEAWDGAETAIVVDALAGRERPGSLQRLDGSEIPPRPTPTSSHAAGVAEALRLGRALGRMPGRLITYGIQGGDFSEGPGLSPPVLDAVDVAVERIRQEVQA